ncbi:MAG: NADAR family protein [Myxococcales bacterium]|nr:NADAR family protein [Myxococcales bacterium]
MDRDDLIARMSGGETPKFLMFWGHTPRAGQTSVGKECLSQWYPSPFELGGQRLLTAEHHMMAEKARLFGDDEALAAILASTHPGEAKRLGRGVRGYDEDVWREPRFRIVVDGNVAKFGAHPDLRAFLLGTGDRVLVEASPQDAVWGIGLAADHTP